MLMTTLHSYDDDNDDGIDDDLSQNIYSMHYRYTDEKSTISKTSTCNDKALQGYVLEK